MALRNSYCEVWLIPEKIVGFCFNTASSNGSAQSLRGISRIADWGINLVSIPQAVMALRNLDAEWISIVAQPALDVSIPQAVMALRNSTAPAGRVRGNWASVSIPQAVMALRNPPTTPRLSTSARRSSFNTASSNGSAQWLTTSILAALCSKFQYRKQ